MNELHQVSKSLLSLAVELGVNRTVTGFLKVILTEGMKLIDISTVIV